VPEPRTWHRRWRWIRAGLGSIVAIALLVGMGLHTRWFVGRPSKPRLSIVVLPFKNLSDDRGEDYLADGITDDLTTDLSRVPDMFVIARESALTYHDKSVDVRKVGDELGVRYVLVGSVRKLDDRLRVNVQLVATKTGAQLWADRFDEQVRDLSSGQEQIVRRLAQTLSVALSDVESASGRRERPTNPDAFDLILRARSIGLHTMGPQEHAERLTLFQQALRLDPGAVSAMAGAANELIRHSFDGYKAKGDELERAAKLLTDAASISPDHPFVLSNAAFLLFAQGRYTESIAASQYELKYFPNDDRAYGQIAECMIFLGRAEEAIPMTEMATKLDPRSAYNWSHYADMGFALLLLGRDEEAIAWTQRALEANSNNLAVALGTFNIRLAASYARLGRYDEAHRALTEANRIWPYDTVRMHWPDDPSSRVYAEQIERFQAALRLAGQRDHADEAADFGVVSDGGLHHPLYGPTSMTTPGATTIRTAELERLLAERKPIVLDPLLYSWGRSIPGAIGLKNVGVGSSLSDAMQDRLRRKMLELTSGDLNKPIVAIGWNSERFDGRNLALRLAALGYTQVYWYRGGREAWEANGLPETAVDVQDW
jgi:adenylate cyclase